jgi:1-deoxy-D-xylulose-5-phosphate reductoisomerase
MRIPIQYALTFPDRLPSPAPAVDLQALPGLTFEPVDEARFPALAIGRAAGRQGSRASAALIAADEVAVRRFLDGTLAFGEIADFCARAVGQFGNGDQLPRVDELVQLDHEIRDWAATA